MTQLCIYTIIYYYYRLFSMHHSLKTRSKTCNYSKICLEVLSEMMEPIRASYMFSLMIDENKQHNLVKKNTTT
jgi:hypothetical protein